MKGCKGLTKLVRYNEVSLCRGSLFFTILGVLYRGAKFSKLQLWKTYVGREPK